MPSTAPVEIVESCLVVLTALFPIVNPLGNSPIFLSLTPGYSSEARATLAWKVALNSYWLLTGSLLIGSHILDFFGISVPVVQIGGGIVVMSTGWTLLQREEEQARESAQKKVSLEDISTRAFYPLTLPLTVGPGSISVAIALGANQAPYRGGFVRLISAIIGPALVALTVYLSYRFAERLAKFLGPTAMNVIVRLAAFILLCIGVQILWNGVHSLLVSAH
ncbi:MAG: MarC family protein [Acidobacteriaceae bacterium]|nr:MarC family protein [Acidobacteriaceae bacterium]